VESGAPDATRTAAEGPPLSQAFALCVFAYALATAVAVIAAVAADVEHPLWTALWADVAATIVIFAFSVGFSNSSFYDAYWSVAPILIAPFFALSAGGEAPASRQLLVLTLVAAWGVRLTWNWARGWHGLSHEDWRYVKLRAQMGSLYWPVSFLGIHMMPTLLVFAGCLALYPALATGDRPLGVLDLAATTLTAGAIWLEGTADNQLRRFRLAGPAPTDILESGLWARCRHPNYLGEILFWWGLYLFALAADPAYWWTGVGAVSITLLFRFVSLPMIEGRMLERRPTYARRVDTTPLLIPRLRGSNPR
jgi:steroid 5-alpha reductase family enzyme